MKTKEELNALKEEAETVSEKLHELTDEELAEVSGGVGVPPELVFEPPSVSPPSLSPPPVSPPSLSPPVVEPLVLTFDCPGVE